MHASLGRIAFSGTIALVAGWALVQTLGWPIKTALYPRVVAIPLLLLAAAETFLSLRRTEEVASGEAVDVTLSAEIPPAVAMRRTLVVAAWIGGFALAVLLIGFPRSVPLFVFAYLRGQAREAWSISLLLPALAWLGFHALFIRLLHIPFADGLLWRLLFK